MTRQEAIKILNKYDLNFCDIDGNPIPPQDLAEAFDMAIEALQQEPKCGHWQQAKDVEIEYAVCTNCKHHGEFYMDYCPNCGSYNGGEKHEV